MSEVNSGNENESNIDIPSPSTLDSMSGSTPHSAQADSEVLQEAHAAQAEQTAEGPSTIPNLLPSATITKGTNVESEPQPHSPSAIEHSVSVQLKALAELFESKIAFDRFKEKQIEALHAELQDYKRGLTESLVLPLIRQIVRYCDQLPRHIQGLQSKPVDQLGPERIFKELAGVREDLHLILENFGVTIFHQVQDSFDTKTQLAKQTESTEDASAHGKVLERLLPGFEYNGKLIEKERVKVAVYRAEKPSPTT